MGNGKKNKIGGAPKAKGRLAQSLRNSIANAEMRAKERKAALDKDERAKSKASGATQAQLKKARKLERAAEKGKERAAEEAGAIEVKVKEDGDEEKEDVEKVIEIKEAKGKRAREERDRRRGTVPYGLGEKVLLVGEGNFSFAHSLLLLNPPTVTPHLLLATSFDTLAVAQEKYPDLMMHVEAIKSKGGVVVFGVDCTDLKKCKEVKDGGVWDRVGFNFPHVGAGISDQDRNVRANQALILKFFRSVSPFLRVGPSSISTAPSKKNKKSKRSKVDSDDEADRWDENEKTELVGELDEEERDLSLAIAPPPPKTAGTVIITLRTSSPYSLWSLPHLGTRGSLIAPSILPKPHLPQPTYKIVRSFDFSPADYEGYEHRRTIGFKEGISSAANDDLSLTAKQRGEKKRAEKEEVDKDNRDKNGKAERGVMRTYEFELVKEKIIDADDAYDDL